jgi:FkbM family methyltransferase
MIPRIIHQIWIGPDPLPDDHRPWIESWKRHHPDWEHRLWTEEDLPSNPIRPEILERLRAPVERADILRLEILYRHGGVYADTDLECLRSMDHVVEDEEFICVCHKPGRVTNTFIGSMPDHPLLERALREIRPREVYWTTSAPESIKETAGPPFLERLVRDYPEVKLLEPPVFFPSTPGERNAAIGVHHMARTWRPPARRLLHAEKRLERLKQKLAQEEQAHAATRQQVAKLEGAREPRPGTKRARRAGREQTRGSSPRSQERRSRVDFYERARTYTSSLEVTVNGARFLVPTDDQVGRTLFVKRRRREFQVLDRAVAAVQALAGEDAVRGRVFIDIGANIGTATVAALVSHEFGSAVSCEPEEENYRLLRANLVINELEGQVRALRVAASNRVGASHLVVTDESRAASWIAVDSDKIRAEKATRAKLAAAGAIGELPEMAVVEVEVVTLDRLVKSGVIDSERVGMLWIDAQGHEGHILDGASSLADPGVPIVLEFHPAGLDEHGDRDLVHEVAERCYTHFIDMRRPGAAGGQPDFRLQSVSELPGYADHLLDPSIPWEVTDLLFTRLDPGQESIAASLPELVRQRLGSASTRD